MPNKIGGIYECGFCSKIYKVKKSYDKHFLVCSILNKSMTERKSENEIADEIPNIREIYNIVQMLIIKNEKLEKQVEKMNTWIHNNKKKVNVNEWLNDNCKPEIDYDTWIEHLEINSDDMEIVINTNFMEGINIIIRRLTENLENIPIKAFEQRDNILFIFNNNEWSIMDAEKCDMLFNKITRGLIGQLKIWQDNNKKRLFDTGFTEKYIEYVKKITGGDLTRDQQYHKIKHSFYNNLKVNIKNIVQYEFVF
jgi:hypothetical protein